MNTTTIANNIKQIMSNYDNDFSMYDLRTNYDLVTDTTAINGDDYRFI